MAPGAGSPIRQTCRLIGSIPASGTLFHGNDLADILSGIRGNARPDARAGLVPVGPRRMRVWWDAAVISGAEDVLADLSRPKMVMRFYDVTGLPPGAQSWNHTFDIEVGLRENGRSVDFWMADRTYLVDLGAVYADGRFVPMARTNAAALPREAKGRPGRERGSSRLAAAGGTGKNPPAASPEAMKWFDRGGDWPLRDMAAETLLFTLYRAFLDEGPRALRRLPPLSIRDPEVLEREYRDRRRACSVRRRAVVKERMPLLPNPFVIARLETEPLPRAERLAHLPAPATNPLASLSREYAGYAEGVLFAARRTIEPRIPAGEVPGIISLFAGAISRPFAAKATPVHEAAANLRKALSGVRSPATGGAAKRSSAKRRMSGAANGVRGSGGPESRRPAGIGARVGRMTVLFEGRAEPGAKLRVAGERVVADTAGRFSVECMLTGRSAKIRRFPKVKSE